MPTRRSRLPTLLSPHHVELDHYFLALVGRSTPTDFVTLRQHQAVSAFLVQDVGDPLLHALYRIEHSALLGFALRAHGLHWLVAMTLRSPPHYLGCSPVHHCGLCL
ncbi:Uncharacterised protein [Vibrio cholerae]|nr:Uncharacterised protein [Vibrio cholerae]